MYETAIFSMENMLLHWLPNLIWDPIKILEARGFRMSEGKAGNLALNLTLTS